MECIRINHVYHTNFDLMPMSTNLLTCFKGIPVSTDNHGMLQIAWGKNGQSMVRMHLDYVLSDRKKDNKFEGLCFKENRASGDDDGDDGNDDDDDDDDNVIVEVSFPSLIRLKNLLVETRHCDKEA